MPEEIPQTETDKKLLEMNELSIQELLKKNYSKIPQGSFKTFQGSFTNC